MARLDARQRRLLELLTPTAWTTTEAVQARTSLYRAQGLGAALGQLGRAGLVERRVVGGSSEWRLTEAGREAR